MNQPRFLMCAPPHFGVHYVINPWMRGQVDATSRDLAAEQWHGLHSRLGSLAKIDLLPPVEGLPDLVFTANAALIYRGCAILSSFRHRERQAEEPYFAQWFAENGFALHTLPREVSFEGAGDALFDRQRPLLWMGTGFRSALEARGLLAEILGLEVIPLRLVDPRFYHLDTCFCPLEGGGLIYFASAFDETSLRAIESRIPSSDRFAVETEDALQFACNAVNVGDTVILPHASPELRQWLERKGFRLCLTPMSEFMRAGGAAKCLSLRLDESSLQPRPGVELGDVGSSEAFPFRVP